ncbi:MAG: PQQ-binding-like beta-propeller repeat protein [Polyangiaceae bacterium]
MRTPLLFAGLLTAATACASGLSEPNSPPPTTSNALAPANPASTTSALEPPPSAPQVGTDVVLPHLWTAVVGRTDARTTMAVVGKTVVIGTHGGSFDALDEPTDGVYLIDGVTGHTIRMIATPGHGRRDVNGIAVDAGRVFFSTGNGQIVAARLDGQVLWTHPLGSEPLAAPTLVEVNGDGALDVVVGDQSAHVHALDGRNGNVLWSRTLQAATATAHGTIEAGIAAADLDGDGKSELVAASWDGTVSALRASSGETLWSMRDDGRVRASPVLADVDGDGRLEVIAAWEGGATRILDGGTGHELWSTVVGRDEKVHVNLLGSPIPFLGTTSGLLAVPVGREPAGDGLFLLGEHGLRLRSGDARVLGTPVVSPLDPKGGQRLLFGTAAGEVVAINPDGRRSAIGKVGGPIDASLMVADVDADGVYEVVVASNDGILTCFTTGMGDAPAIARFRGNSATNNGVMSPTNLRWEFGRARAATTKGAP